MPFTAAQRTDAYRFFAIAFGAAPGVTHLRDIELAYEGGAPTKQIVNEYAKKSAFKAAYPDALSDSQFAISIVDNVAGASASASARSEAALDILLALRGGATRGDVIFQIFSNLAGLRGDAKWGQLAAKLDNQVTVAKFYTETLLGSSDNSNTLRSALAGVDGNTDVSVAGLSARLGPLVGTSLSGKVIDGYIRGAAVFVDYNGNGVADTDIERITLTSTDAQGGYTMNAPRAGGVIVASGGVNIDTGNANTLVLKAPNAESGAAAQRTLSPVTTLITSIATAGTSGGAAPTAAQIAAAETAVRQSLGLSTVSASLLTLDPVAVSTSTSASAADRAAALSVFKVGVQIAVLTVAAQTNATTAAARAEAAAALFTSLATTIATANSGSTGTSGGAATPVPVLDLTKSEVVTQLFTSAKVTVAPTVVASAVATAAIVATAATTTAIATTQSTFESAPTVVPTAPTTPTIPTTPATTPTTPTTPTVTPSAITGSDLSNSGRSTFGQAETLTGGSGNDSILGGGGNDTIDGLGGTDTIDGGAGADQITLGTGNVRVRVAAGETGTILSYTGTIDISSLDRIVGFNSGDVLQLPFTGDPVGIRTSAPTGREITVLQGTVAGSSFAVGSGIDLIVAYDSNGDTSGGVVEAVVLIGAAPAITGATGGTGGTGGTGVTGVVGG
jgi:hypothetical protein